MILDIEYLTQLPMVWQRQICMCNSPHLYKLPKIDWNTEVCATCRKPPAYKLHRCTNCSEIFLQHGLTKFKHPAFCVINPLCWDCCSLQDEPTRCYSHCEDSPNCKNRLSVVPPRKLKVVHDPNFDIFA